MLHSIDFNQASGFSEYELLGNYAARFHSDEMALATTKWIRRGNRLIGGISSIDTPRAKRRLQGYDFAAFESWDAPKDVHGQLCKLLRLA